MLVKALYMLILIVYMLVTVLFLTLCPRLQTRSQPKLKCVTGRERERTMKTLGRAERERRNARSRKRKKCGKTSRLESCI